jgi:2-phosphosulfolactate phosphatase
VFSGQAAYDVRFEWGADGLAAVGPGSDAIVLVDVLSFGTCVDVAAARGAFVLPYPRSDESAERYARDRQALLAAGERLAAGAYSLSPQSLLAIPAGTRLVLPSPNGSALSLRAAGPAAVLSACLRNSEAVARTAGGVGRSVAVVACGERWQGGGLRPCLEDLIGAGAVIRSLPGARSPEARSAVAAYEGARADLPAVLRGCASGRQLIERGFACDVEIAAEWDVSGAVPRLVGDAFVDAASGVIV